ncbi:murein L,D-transpeptidase catalytic domain family protein [Sphingomonas sp. KR1UV-12]|uniref:Murein L,D-transpeptidase catalytic domain family protein n=1 Tax=Sphingomonas aurea TaxID=3063994 RepID=A0ABT9EJJ4_9SPHN|nr:murein L,D-transpeptidase catalytic domain family protein [Sphingomonas sp. KR1UV-12]MDP1027116.1 murein L,D-transpeptidase catalytic domain family protein [Sphingomonas sp. KR1UV-12]
MHDHDIARGRRALLKNGLLFAGVMAVPGAVSSATRRLSTAELQAAAKAPAAPLVSPNVVRPELLRQALASLDRQGSRVAQRDRMGIVDFTAGSSQPRFHFVDLASGRSTSLLVAHGSGSDPAHTGYLKRFSNDFGSNASSEGAFVTGDYYVGKHGRSQRLIGLDPTNCNALGRALVIHSAWYANPDMIRTHGMLGRSQGCFAVGEKDLDQVFARLGQGRMIYAAKV